jgi:hypothetical protein
MVSGAVATGSETAVSLVVVLAAAVPQVQGAMAVVLLAIVVLVLVFQ